MSNFTKYKAQNANKHFGNSLKPPMCSYRYNKYATDFIVIYKSIFGNASLG